jgi:hypothetical protein
VRILDSTLHAGRPARLHPSRHMLQAETPHSYWSPRRPDIEIKAFHIRRNRSVATLDMEIVRGVEGGFPTGNENPETFRRMIEPRVNYVREFRAKLGEGWPIGAYALLPNAQSYAPAVHAAFNDPAADAWRRNREHPDVKPHLEKWAKWREGNDAIAKVMLPHLDFLCPQLYVLGDDRRDWGWLLAGTVEEARRVAGGKPIYPFLMPHFWEVDNNPRAGQPIPYEFFKHQLDTCLAAFDGVVIWGGLGVRYDPQAGWVRALREKLDELDAGDAKGAETRPAPGPATKSARSTPPR